MLSLDLMRPILLLAACLTAVICAGLIATGLAMQGRYDFDRSGATFARIDHLTGRIDVCDADRCVSVPTVGKPWEAYQADAPK